MLHESEGFEEGNMTNLLQVQYVNIADHLFSPNHVKPSTFICV